MSEINVAQLHGFVTTGDDKKVRIWSKKGQLWGCLDLLKEKVSNDRWHFPYSWKSNKMDQMKEVKKTIELMEKKHTKKTNLSKIEEGESRSAQDSYGDEVSESDYNKTQTIRTPLMNKKLME